MGGEAQIRGDWKGPRPRVSVVILTLNEEINVRECIESCSFTDDVHVLDSCSTDRTQELGREAGAQVYEHAFESFGKQRNWAIDNIDLKYDWVFHLDADERFTPALVAEIAKVLGGGPGEAGFHVPHKLMFMDRWLRRAGGYPTYQMRLFHKGRMRFVDYGHGQREEEGMKVGKFEEPYLHFVFSKGLYDWIDKHNRYSSLEALNALEIRNRALEFSRLLHPDPVQRRRVWKELSYRLPARPLLRWMFTMFILGGALEGHAGWTYARLLAMYERMIQVKLRMLRRRSRAAARGFEQDGTPQAKREIFEGADRPGAAPTRLAPQASQAEAIEQSAPAVETDRTDDLGQLLPEASPWTFGEKVGRALWMLVGRPVFRMSFHNWYGFRTRLLRLFGARIGKGVRLRPTVHVEVPWNIEIRDGATVGDNAILYSLGQITIGERTIVSQYAHLCAGTHDYSDRRFPLIRDPITIGADAWIGADAYVGPNVTMGRLAILGARSSAYKDLEAGQVYVGNPAKRIKERELH